MLELTLIVECRLPPATSTRIGRSGALNRGLGGIVRSRRDRRRAERGCDGGCCERSVLAHFTDDDARAPECKQDKMAT